jgi:hypothetical protein
MFFQFINETQTVVLFHLFTSDQWFVQLHYHEKDGQEFRNMFSNVSANETPEFRKQFFDLLWLDLQQRGVPDYMYDRLYRWFIDSSLLDS